MKRFDWYIIKKFLSTFLFTLSLILVIVIVFDISEKIDDFLRSEVSLNQIVFQYYLNFIPYFANLFSPLFIFISVIYFTSKMASNSEIIAILNSGMSFTRLIRPFIISEENDICFDIPNNSVDFGEKIAAYYFWVFPNMMFNFYPWGISVNIIKPVAVKKTKIDFISFVWDEEKLNKGAGGDLDKVELEDEEIVQRVQKGVGSRFYKNGRFSPKMEKGVHHFHSLISKFLFK